MRTKNLLMMAALIAVATACSKSDETPAPSNFPADGVIRIAATVEESATTRAGITTENIDNFNLNIVNDANSAYSYFAFYRKSSGEWTAKDNEGRPQTLLWQNNTQPITVTALSLKGSKWTELGFNSEVSCNVQPDQSDEEILKKSDYLYMESKTINPATDLIDGKLPIKLKHLLSKVYLTVKLGTEFNAAPGTATNPITGLKVNGTIISSRWNPSTNSAFDFTGYKPNSITPYAGTYTAGNSTTSSALARYECILLPQTVAKNGFSVSFTLDGKDYTWTSAAVTLARGTAYDLELTVGTATPTRSASAGHNVNATVSGILSASQTWNK